MYTCPHCGKEIKEVSVVELNAKQMIASAGLGLGVGLFAWQFVTPVGAFGGFLVAAIITLLFLKRRS